MKRPLFLSIHPEFTDKILSGTKTVEFRRTRPRACKDRAAILYATSPVMAIVGVARVDDLVSSSPTKLWNMFRDVGGITRARLRDYFRGVQLGHAIALSRVTPLKNQLNLSTIRDAIPGFHPPQGFFYVTVDQVESLGIRDLENTVDLQATSTRAHMVSN